MSCKNSLKRRHDKYGVGGVRSIKLLAPISLVKSGLYFGIIFIFPSCNPKSPSVDLILRPAFIANARGHYSNILSLKLLVEVS